MTKTNGSKTSAFTLIELLVVIAIIAILAAILFPVFATAREKARQTTCASNMKQISLAVLQYTQDFDELVPYDSMNNGPIGLGSPVTWEVQWNDLVYPYIKATGVFNCPDADDAIGVWVPVPNRILAQRYQYGSYAANSGYRNPSSAYHSPIAHFDSGKPSLVPNTALSKIVAPATTVCILDGGAYSAGKWGSSNKMVWWDSTATDDPVPATCGSIPCIGYPSANTSSWPPARHSGMINVGWCDGHVKAMTITDLLTKQTAGGPLHYFNNESK